MEHKMNELESVKQNSMTNSFDQAQVDILRNVLFKGFSDDEMKFCLAVCSRTKLDPFSRQIYFNKRKNNKTGKETITFITGIDGLRLTAQRTGAYAGSPDITYELDKEALPVKATCTVRKLVQGHIVDFTASVHWNEFYPGDGPDGFMWRKMPFQLLGKCCEAQSLRKGFPAELSGLYIDEEMHQADSKQQMVQTKAQKVQALLDAKPIELEVKAHVEVEKEPEAQPNLGPSDDVAQYLIPIGKLKGKRLKDVPKADLQKFYEWGIKQEHPSMALEETLEATQAYLEGL
jgi:phage recombination protein Bet